MDGNSEMQAELGFSAGDVVWVRVTRIGWWPSVVMKSEELPESFGEVNPKAVAVVKFFNEDEYEEVMQSDKIRTYKCEDRLDFIKQGMVKYLDFQKRLVKTSPYENFPSSVEQAEKLSGGDPALAEPKKYEVKKTPMANKYKDIFVNPEEKVKPSPKSASRGTKAKSSPQKTPLRITHPRFHGASDHEVRIRQQPSPLSDDERHPSPAISSSPGHFKCELCNFTSNRLNVIILHRKSHKDEPTTTPVKAKTKRREQNVGSRSVKRRKLVKPKEENASDLFDKVKKESLSGPVKAKTPVKRTPKKPVEGTPAKSPKKIWLSQVQTVDPEVKNKILADWDDDEETEIEEKPEKQGNESDEEERKIFNSNLVKLHSDDEESEVEETNGNAKEVTREAVSSKKEERKCVEQNDEKLKEELEALLAETAPPVLPNVIKEPLNEKLLANERETVHVESIENLKENGDAVEQVAIGDDGKIVEDMPNDVVESHKENEVAQENHVETTKEKHETACEVSSTTTNSEPLVLGDEESYVFVAYDTESDGGLQEFTSLDNALLAYGPSTDGTTQTLLIDAATLQSGADLGNLFLTADESNEDFDTNHTPN